MEPYRHGLSTGRLIVLDERTNGTVGAAMVRPAEPGTDGAEVAA